MFVKWCANLIAYPFTEESMQDVETRFGCDEHGWLFTAMDQAGIPIGFFAISKVDYEQSSGHLGFVVINTDRRNKGYGKQMLAQAVNYAFNILKISRLTLKVFDNNPAAHACYKKVGFIDEAYTEKSFAYKDELWGCYDMAIQTIK
jgi:RimJ/RimL family protein N-acetyltransferase